MKTKIYISLCLLLSLLSCTKDDNETRRTGDETISCYINGKLWQNSASVKTIGGATHYSYTSLGNVKDFYGVYGKKWDVSSLYLMASSCRNDDSTYYDLHNSVGNLSLLIDKKEKNTMTFRSESDIKYLSKEKQGFIKLISKYNDFNQPTLEGYFEAILYNENDPTDVLHITDGRFTRIFK
ncbi:MAG: hypothetical protein ACPGSD_08840 [Flavobacteriales bacterium]